MSYMRLNIHLLSLKPPKDITLNIILLKTINIILLKTNQFFNQNIKHTKMFFGLN